MSQPADQQQSLRWHLAFSRQLIVIVVSLLLGVVSGVAVAWDIARKGPTFTERRAPARWSSASGPAWLYLREESFGAVRLRGQFASSWAAGTRAATGIEPPPPWSAMAHINDQDPTQKTLREEAFGWPQPMLMSQIVSTPGRVGPINAIDLGPHPTCWGERLYLPKHPIWRGLVVNAIFYGCLWWIALGLLMVLWPWLRGVSTSLRQLRGRCPNCAYDLRGRFDAGCSECGWRRHNR